MNLQRFTDRVPRRLVQRARRLLRPALLGMLRRTSPLSPNWGFDRGTPVDRYYIEQFLHEHRACIRGRVLEVKDSTYTDRYGSGVTRRDIVDIDPTNAAATIVADLSQAHAIATGTFDCFILTQTLHLIYDTKAVLAHAHRILRPGGTMLATMPVVSRVVHGAGLQHDFWRFTAASSAALFGEAFGTESVVVRSYGNVLSGVAFLMGMAHEEVSRRQLEVHDPYFPLVIAVRATKR